MTKEQFLKFAEEFYQDCMETSRKKNSDYTGDSDDPFKNFTSIEVLGIRPELGFITRMMDKMSRLASLSIKNLAEVQSESTEDTLKDLASYSCLFAAYLKSKQEIK